MIIPTERCINYAIRQYNKFTNRLFIISTHVGIFIFFQIISNKNSISIFFIIEKHPPNGGMSPENETTAYATSMGEG